MSELLKTGVNKAKVTGKKSAKNTPSKRKAAAVEVNSDSEEDTPVHLYLDIASLHRRFAQTYAELAKTGNESEED